MKKQSGNSQRREEKRSEAKGREGKGREEKKEERRSEERKRERKRERERERERERRQKMQVREKVAKSRNTVFFKRFVAPEGREVGALKRRARRTSRRIASFSNLQIDREDRKKGRWIDG